MQAFRRDGYVIARGLASPEMVAAMRRVAERHLAARIEPLELEADLRYPGAPSSRDAEGGSAVRRLRQAYARHEVFRRWVTSPSLVARLRALLGPVVLMPQAHHNCVMTKLPRFSSDSQWHQDIRYWRYRREALITAWLALGHEHPGNGGLQLIPGSHRMTLAPDRFDEARFFRNDLPDNQAVLEGRQALELEAGDVLLFHCRLLHAATRNRESQTKLSAVFTFRAADDTPVPGTRSASQSDIPVAPL